MSIKIGIVVPVYRVEKYLDKCVTSIMEQTYSNWKLVLVDDGSPDSCPQMCDDYTKKDKRISVIHKENGGLVSAWKAGVLSLNSDVEYVVFIDSDDWITEDYLKLLAETQQKNDTDIVVTQLRNKFPDGSELQKPFIVPVEYYDRDSIEKVIFPCMLNTGSFHIRAISCSRCGKLIRKNLILDNLKYISENTTYAEDLNIIFPVLLNMDSVDFIQNEACLYCIRANPNSMTHAYDKNMLKSITYVYDSLENIIIENESKDIFNKQLLADYLAASVQYYKNELQNPNGLRETYANIENFCTGNKRLDKAIKQVDWHNYRLLNKVIIKSMDHFSGLNKYVVVPTLSLLKHGRSRKLAKFS